MIKRIRTLKRTGRFEVLKSTRGSEGDFSDLNIIYAHNACGKSTLCDVLRSMGSNNGAYVMGRSRLTVNEDPEIVVLLDGGSTVQTVRYQNGTWHNHEICPPIHIYDDRFVAENVFIGHQINVDQRRNLYGLVIGEQAIALQQAVSDAEQNLRATTVSFNSAQKQLNSLLPEDQTVESFRSTPVFDDVDAQIEAATEEFTFAKQTKDMADAIRQRRPLLTLPVAEVDKNLEQVLSATLDDAALEAEQKIREHIAATSDGLTIEWVAQGHRAQTGTDCPLCGQNMQGLEVLKTYRAYFSGQLQEQETLRNQVKSAINYAFGESAQARIHDIMVAHNTERTWWNDAAGYHFDLPSNRGEAEIISAMQDVHTAIDNALARKQASQGCAIALTANESQAVYSWKEIITELARYNDGITALTTSISERQSDATDIDLSPLQERISSLELSKKRYEQDVIAAYADFDTKKQEKTAAQQVKQRANEELRTQSDQLFEQYGARVNELLRLFAVDYRIVNGGVSFRGGPPSGQLAIELLGQSIASTPEACSDPSCVSIANTLSGGDRSALGLAFFLAKIELDPNIANCIVVFDDPYHNQDRSRRQCTIERVHQIVGTARQCFVLSHDLEFARAVDRRPGTQIRTFYLKPIDSQTNLEAQPLPLLPSQAYEKNYRRLYGFIEAPEAHLDHLKEIADTIRVILEEYIRFKFPVSFNHNDWLGDIIRKIRDAAEGTPLHLCATLTEELSRLNDYSKRFHHASSGEQADEPEPRELKSYVERTLRVIHIGGQI